MRPIFAFLLICCCIAFVFATPASACINDREVGKAEREFKSSYMGNTPNGQTVPAESSPGEDSTKPIAFLSIGSVLLVGAFVVTLKRPKG
jgi:hypothetical protein